MNVDKHTHTHTHPTSILICVTLTLYPQNNRQQGPSTGPPIPVHFSLHRTRKNVISSFMKISKHPPHLPPLQIIAQMSPSWSWLSDSCGTVIPWKPFSQPGSVLPPPGLPSVYPATSCASKVIGMVFVSPNRTWAPQGHKCCKQNPSCLQIYLIASNTAWLIILPLRIESFNECINIERMLAYKMGKELENQIPVVIQKHWAEGWVIMDFSHLGEGFWVIMTRQKWN